MQITDRQYPYPMLNFYESDFKSSTYAVYIGLEGDSENILLDVKFDLDSAIIATLIESGKASFAIHLECGRTRYRKLMKTKNSGLLISINSKDVNGDLEVVPMIILNEDIKDYMSDEFIEDFDGESFNISKGCMLAIAESRKIMIEKEGDNSSNVPSIFSIQKKEKLENGLDWYDNTDKIIISVSEDKYQTYKLLCGNKELVGMLSILIILPVLVEIVSELKNDEDAYSECIWMDVIKSKLEKMKINIKNESPTMIAHKILEGALENSFNTIKTLVEEEE
ncbi:MAG: hypothetical protein ACRCWG_13720 [Sarcina sp.]